MGKGDVHPLLIPLLEQFQISKIDSWKQGRPSSGIREKRAKIITHLHKTGSTWLEMVEITGLSLMTISRLSQAKGCEASKDHLRSNGRLTGSKCKGMKRPWLSQQLRGWWAEGKFEYQRGRSLSLEHRERLRFAWTPELRHMASLRKQKDWADPVNRSRYLQIFRDAEYRKRSSQRQSLYLQKHPIVKGRGSVVTTLKGHKEVFWVRSRYEVKAVSILEERVDVVSFEYEPRLSFDGFWILPDFLIHLSCGRSVLIEVKSQWVLDYYTEGDRPIQRLHLAERYASRMGWGFEIWTEKELGLGYRSKA